MTARLMMIHALSPLHAGTGQSVGAIDLPIARERATGIPYLPGSSLKGALRDRSDQREDLRPQTKGVFGPPTENASEHSGSVFFGDARLLLFPVRSIAGTFAWVTSPYLLGRLARDLRESGHKSVLKVPDINGAQTCLVPGGSQLVLKGEPKRVIFEDLDFQPAGNKEQEGTSIAQLVGGLCGPLGLDAAALQQRLCIVHDDVLAYLVEHATEVAARIRLDNDTKTVAKGALWYEEALPAESVLVSLLLFQPTRQSGLTADTVAKHLDKLTEGAVQLGGKATVGRGLCALHLTRGA